MLNQQSKQVCSSTELQVLIEIRIGLGFTASKSSGHRVFLHDVHLHTSKSQHINNLTAQHTYK